MRLGLLGCLLALVITGSLPGLAEQPAGPATLENLLNSEETQEPAAAEKSATDPERPAVRPEGTLVRPKDGVQHPDLGKAWTAYDAAVAKATESIKTAIAKQFDAAAAKGDLDEAEKWQIALEKFEKAGELPAETETKAAASSAVGAYKKAREELTEAYEAVVKALTVNKKIEDARKVRDEGVACGRDEKKPTQAPSPKKTAAEKRTPSRHRIEAGKSWQPTVQVVAGQSYVISAQGRWTSNVATMPWQGPEFLGDNGLRARVGEGASIKVGEGTTLRPTESGLLFFELFGNAKSNDRGFVEVTIH